eukprot:Lithocolla_globosa_v1_NODE_3954_length_1544_cov_10.349228.p2 type:complete len:101 gc:universal NODE_3954_length_1544_cov_10.349228:511-209(-)
MYIFLLDSLLILGERLGFRRLMPKKKIRLVLLVDVKDIQAVKTDNCEFTLMHPFGDKKEWQLSTIMQGPKATKRDELDATSWMQCFEKAIKEKKKSEREN